MTKVKDIDGVDRLPVKESMRGTHHKEGWDMKIYDQGRHNYKIVYRYLYRILEKSIGRNFNKVKKHIFESLKYNDRARRESSVIDNCLSTIFNDEHGQYIIDSQGRIQKNKESEARKKYWTDKRKKNRTTLVETKVETTYMLDPKLTSTQIDVLKGYLIEKRVYNIDFFNHLVHGGIISDKKYRDFIESISNDGWIKTSRWGGEYLYHTKEHIENCFVVASSPKEYVLKDGSPEYKQYKKEQRESRDKIRRKYIKERELKNETLLHDIENRKKIKEREKDVVDRDRLGFDEDSFMGEPYHGQKRKKRAQ